MLMQYNVSWKTFQCISAYFSSTLTTPAVNIFQYLNVLCLSAATRTAAPETLNGLSRLLAAMFDDPSSQELLIEYFKVTLKLGWFERFGNYLERKKYFVLWFIWSKSVDKLRLSCIFSFGSVWFGFTQAKFLAHPRLSTKAMSCHSLHSSEITSVKSPLLQSFAKHFELCMICMLGFFLTVGLCGHLAKNQEGNVLHPRSMPTLHSCLCHNKLPAVCLQSRPPPTVHSTAGYRSWFSPKMCNSSVVGVDWGITSQV